MAEDVFADERARLEVFGYSDDDAFAVGLSCGGTLDVLVEPVAAGTFPALAGAPCALIRALPAGSGDTACLLPLLITDPAAAAAPAALLAAHGPELAALLNVRPEAALPEGVLHRAAARLAPLLAAGRTGVVELDGPASGTCESSAPALFLESRLAPPRLVLIGANDFSAALARQGRLLGYHVTICDARPVFTTPERFPAAHSVQVQWPDQYLRGEAAAGRLDARTVVCVLSHDAKFDVPALAEALRLDLAYVGAMGSRRSHGQRLTALHAAGLGAAELQALHSPLGLDIGAATPEETAVSVFAEIVAARSGTAASGRPLRAVSGPIHPHTSLTS